jgi:hypothetical protein
LYNSEQKVLLASHLQAAKASGDAQFAFGAKSSAGPRAPKPKQAAAAAVEATPAPQQPAASTFVAQPAQPQAIGSVTTAALRSALRFAALFPFLACAC